MLLDWLDKSTTYEISSGSIYRCTLKDRDHPPILEKIGQRYSIPDAYETLQEIAADFAPVFDQGKAVLALRMDHPFPKYSEIITRVEREEHRFIVYYDPYVLLIFIYVR